MMHQPAPPNARDAVLAFRSSTSAEVSTNMAYLHSTINWAVTLFAGGFATMLLQAGSSERSALALDAVLFVVTVHFFVRTSKAYINVMRFTSLDKALLHHIAHGEYDEGYQLLHIYYINWISPVAASTVLYKTLIEFGFLYLFTALIAIGAYLHYKTGVDPLITLVPIGVISFLEVRYGLLKSPYLRIVEPLNSAVDQR
jgi:hypothetical protein